MILFKIDLFASIDTITQKSAIGRFLLVIMEAQDLMISDSNERSKACFLFLH